MTRTVSQFLQTYTDVRQRTASLVVTIMVAALAALSRLGKLRSGPEIVHVVHEIVGVPLEYFPPSAACEFAVTVDLVFGMV